MIAKEKLVFDVTDAGTIAASDSLGAYVRAGDDGTLIGHVSDALKVNFTNTSLAVTATDLDIRDLTQADEITVFQGTDPWIIADGGGSITVDGSVSITGSVTVTATDLDIRDLQFATDSVDVSGSSVSITGDVNVTQGTSPWVIGDGGGSITVDGSVTVSATDLDIRDLSASQDSVASHLFDGSGNAITSSSGALDVNIQSSDIEINVEDDKANVALENSAVSVTTTSAALLASQLSARKFMWVQNLGNRAIFVGKSGVTTSNGLRLSPGSVLEIRLGPSVSMHAVSDSGTQDTRVMEAS